MERLLRILKESAATTKNASAWHSAQDVDALWRIGSEALPGRFQVYYLPRMDNYGVGEIYNNLVHLQSGLPDMDDSHRAAIQQRCAQLADGFESRGFKKAPMECTVL